MQNIARFNIFFYAQTRIIQNSKQQGFNIKAMLKFVVDINEFIFKQFDPESACPGRYLKKRRKPQFLDEGRSAAHNGI